MLSSVLKTNSKEKYSNEIKCGQNHESFLQILLFQIFDMNGFDKTTIWWNRVV